MTVSATGGPTRTVQLRHGSEGQHPRRHEVGACRTTRSRRRAPRHDADLHQHDTRAHSAPRSTRSSSPKPSSRPARTARTAAGRPWSTATASRSRTRATASASTRTGETRSARKPRGQLAAASSHRKAHHHGPRPVPAGGGCFLFVMTRPRRGDVPNHALRQGKSPHEAHSLTGATTSGAWPRREPTGASW